MADQGKQLQYEKRGIWLQQTEKNRTVEKTSINEQARKRTEQPQKYEKIVAYMRRITVSPAQQCKKNKKLPRLTTV